MYSGDDFQYALENTRVIQSPDRRIESFGTTQFHFYLVSELMDSANEVKVRTGQIKADRPRLLTPESMAKLLLQGFGESAVQFAEKLHARNAAIFRYGFEIRKENVDEHVVHDSIEAVVARVTSGVPDADRSASAVIQGVEEGWEICLLKFTIELAAQSAQINWFDFKRKGLL